MKIYNEFEKYRRDIDILKNKINIQEEYIREYENDKETIENVEKKMNLYIISLEKLNNDFQNCIFKTKNNDKTLTSWVNNHIEVVNNINNFFKIKFQKPVKYTSNRVEVLANIKTSWHNFVSSQILPNTYLIEDYNLFFDIRKIENEYKINSTFIPNSKIKDIESLRQEISVLEKLNLKNDTILDKGSTWGMSNNEINRAEKDFPIISDKIKSLDSKLNSLISKISDEQPKVINKWILLHLYTCIAVIADSYTTNIGQNKPDLVRLGLASDIFYEWKSILSSKNKYIIPNVYYLDDYNEIFNEMLEQIRF